MSVNIPVRNRTKIHVKWYHHGIWRTVENSPPFFQDSVKALEIKYAFIISVRLWIIKEFCWFCWVQSIYRKHSILSRFGLCAKLTTNRWHNSIKLLSVNQGGVMNCCLPEHIDKYPDVRFSLTYVYHLYLILMCLITYKIMFVMVVS